MTSLKTTQKHWVYRLSVEQVALIFEANDLSCFGRNQKQKHSEFIKEYNELFNSNSDDKQFDSRKTLLRLFVKFQKLRAMYSALTTCEAENSKKEFKTMFGKEFETIDDLKFITETAKQLDDKIKILTPKDEPTKKGLSFVKTVIVVEESRKIPINRKIKLYEFYEMYKTELEKVA